MTTLLAASRVGALGPELMVNGSFEQRGSGAGKSPFAGWTGREWDGGTYDFTAGKGRDGGVCVVITCVKQGRGGVGQVKGVQLDPGKRYFFGMWVKEEHADGGPVFVNFWSPDAGDITRKTLPGGTHDWMCVTKVVQPTQACTLNLYVHNKSIGSVWVDDVSLRELAPGETPPGPGQAGGPEAARPPYGHLPAGADYALGTASPLVKVFPDETFAGKPSPSCELTAARGESEGFQLVILHPRKDLKAVRVSVTPLVDAQSGARIPPSAVTISPVDFINVRVESERMYIPRFGPYPEVLLPNAPFDVKKDTVQPVFIDVKVASEASPGTYAGQVTVVPGNSALQTLTLSLKVRRFEIPWGRMSHIRTISFMGEGWKGVDGRLEDYEDLALEHRLGVGGFAVSGTSGFGIHNNFRNWGQKPPDYDFKWIEPKLNRLMANGMNAFMTAVVPNLHRAGKDAYPPGYYATLGEFVREYHDFARGKGWADCAFVYGYDEVPPQHFQQMKEVYAAVKKACPEARVLLCMNEASAVKTMADHCDVYLLYIHNHLQSRVDGCRKPHQQVWWSYGCIYPSGRPNQFLVYPALDVRIMPWLAHKYGVEGLSVWGLTYYHAASRGRRFPTADWVTTSAAPGDGCIIYPGPQGQPLASFRLKAIRDGLEDYEYLWLLDQKARNGNAAATRLLGEIHGAFRQPTVYTDDPAVLMKWRDRIGDVLDETTR